ncbi:MAG TPA: carboxypeptidase regulatory-like domain-containing protein, partial [Thermoanaerobaculia bacterium]
MARGELAIVGLGLEVDRNPVVTAVDVPSYVQTFFGGKAGEEALPAPGLSARGELTGPGIDEPITLSAIPGQKFAIPALHEKGEYLLQNMRLVGASGEYLQPAVPAIATIQVTDVLQTRIRVRQLTPEELRERGILIDDRNYEVYEYTFIFGVDGQEIEVPYPVIIDKRTREIVPAVPAPFRMVPYDLKQKPPRFSPPHVEPFDLSPGGYNGGDEKDKAPQPGGVSLPAALVVPTGFGVLHQFFAVILQVNNSAPDGSNIRLDSVSAKITSPLTMRVAKVLPAVALGQPVPIVDETTGATFLVAGAQGSAEWTLEALKAGTHTVDIDVRATYQKPGQADFNLGGRVSTSIVVSDPRFHVNFSHPDVVRKDDQYTAYAFVTNLSSQRQHVFLDLSDIPACSSGSSANNICRFEGAEKVELDMGPGEMIPVPHKLVSRVTGKVYAGAGAASDETVGVSLKLTMGVSESGIPLSPATLVMPYYAQFLPPEFVDGNMQLLGLGYSLATAPLTKHTALKPRVITTDVFRRAQQIALAGQRIFTIRKNRDVNDPAENRDAFFHLALDLLGNIERVDQYDVTPELAEYDQLRRSEEAGRIAGAAMARQLEHGTDLAGQFATATSHRTPFLFAYVHGPPVAGKTRPYALSVHGLSSQTSMDIPAEATNGWVRGLAFGELTRMNIGGDEGELALAGRWSENVRISVVPAAASFTLHLLYPDTTSGQTLRTDIEVTNATVGVPVTIDVARGSRTLIVKNATATPLVNVVGQTPLAVLGAAQDLHLDPGGHVVTLLFNRPIEIAETQKLRDLLALTINVAKAGYTATRRNDPLNPNAELQIPAATLQHDGRTIAITFDKTLSTNAAYAIAVESIADRLAGGVDFAANGIVPRLDNNRPAAILTGKVLKGDNTPVPKLLVRMQVGLRVKSFGERFTELVQYDVAGDDGRYLFEYVPRDVDSGQLGDYDLIAETAEGAQARLHGSVRLPGEVHFANLVFLGRGKARGQVRWETGEPIANANVAAGSSLFGGVHGATTDANGNYEIDGLPVGPLVFSTIDPDGRVVYATNSIRTAGEVIAQDLVALRKEGPPPGTATVRVQLLRGDTMKPVANGGVGVGNEFVQLMTCTTDPQGRCEFRGVPAGLTTIIGAEYGISRHGAAVEVELHRDQVLEQTLVLQVADPSVKYATLEGLVIRDDPASPGDTTKDQAVKNAQLSIFNLPSVTANADGTYIYPDIPVTFSGRWIQVFDPATSRHGWFRVPTLVEGSNRFPIRLSSTNPFGRAGIRVRLSGGKGEPVAGARVFVPGYPPAGYGNKGGGVYELEDVTVPHRDTVMAVIHDPSGPYGEQYVQGSTRADFDGQIGITDLRLPGNGTVVVKIEMEQPCSTPPCYAQAVGPVQMTYLAWDDYMQKVMPKTVIGDPDPATNLVTFRKVPARQDVIFETWRHPAGYDRQQVLLAFDGDLRNVNLRLKTIGNVTGRVYAHDGLTPIAGATVRIRTGTAVYAPAQTKQDGSFLFAAIPAATSFDVTAELQQDGIFRTGIVSSRTPEGGGPVSDLIVVMREQTTIEGRVVDDGTGEVVPLAKYWLRELAWPYRAIGTPQDPLSADVNGRFIVSNVFTGAFRVTAVDPGNQELRGDYQGTLAEEGDVSQRDVRVRIGGGGTGTASITVVDPLLGFEAVPNAEVSIFRGSNRFDFTTTNDAGVAYFEQLPVGSDYSVFVYSKQRGRSGSSSAFALTTNATTSESVELDFLGIVSGMLTDPDTEPPNQPVRGQPITYQGPISLRASSGADGTFEFNGVPEGSFALQGWELSTQRIANGPPGLFISKLVPEQRNVSLQMERMGTLTVKVHLPNDAGGPGELAPLVEVTAVQCTVCNVITPDYPYYRSAQGNPVVFPRMFRRVGYSLQVRELGGENRVMGSGGSFPANAIAHEQVIVLPQSGTIEVTVRDGQGNPVADAEVVIGPQREARVFTAADGRVTVTGMPFGWYSAHATKGTVTAAASGELKSRSQPLQLTLNLGTNVRVTGEVDAEEGAGLPSAGTRVILTATTSLLTQALRLEALTDANGEFAFTGIPVSNTNVSLMYFGPDDTTIGATQSMAIPNGSTGTVALPRVKLDATPPRVLAIDPPANATNVSPSSPVTVTFSEQLASEYLNRNWFDLIATDDGASVQTTVQGSVRPDGTFTVKIIPPPPSGGQTFPLKSNVLYRFAIRDGIQDTTGNKLKTAIGTSFTTVNYTEPAVVKVDPPETEPVPQQVTFRIKFNKAVDLASFDAGNGGLLTLERLDAYKGIPVKSIPISRHPDVADPGTILVAPAGVAIAESSFYRITIGGVRDTQTPPNVQKETRVFEFFSFDLKKPVVQIVSPVAAGEKLTAGVLYSAGVAITSEGSTADANDIAYVDWLDAGGVSIARVKTKPYAYSFVAPSNGSTYTLQATATDLSGNTSATPAEFTWSIAPNLAPTAIAITNDVTSVYPTGRVETRVRFQDEGVSVTVALELRGLATDGSELRQIIASKNITRASTSTEFAEGVFVWNAPLSLKDGTATIVATVTDSVNHAATGETPLTILLDQTAPQLVSFLPKAENRYKFGVNGTYTVELQVKDAETGIARALFSVAGVEVLNATSGTYDAATKITTFRKDVSVPPKNADTRVPVVVTAFDHRGNSVTETHEVIYERVDDSTLPRAAWLTPLDGAALPSNQTGWLATLRVRATDDVKVTRVRFESAALAAPIELTAPKSGTIDVFETKAALTFPADNASFVIKAVVSDGDPSHDVELPITIDPLAPNPVVTGEINITAATAAQYANKSVLIRGNVRVYISVPLTLQDLVLVDGAVLSVPEETKLDVTVTGRLFVDGDSRIDVSAKGYLGGLQRREDNSFTNESRSGRTLSGTGATNGDGSHGGIGGSFFGATNATYGSLVEPLDFGSGGGAEPNGSRAGANGGGVVRLDVERLVLAGAIRADHGSVQGGSLWTAGSGGSVNVRARSLITGPTSRITANGGDEGASLDQDLGGGGGRVAVRVTERFDADAETPLLQARGGRNAGAEDPGYVDGGAGTVFVQRPGAAIGELIVSAYDERFPISTHRTAGTPLAGALSFDTITIGPRALARFDVDVPPNVTAHASAQIVGPADLPSVSHTTTTPAAGASVAQNTSINARSTAASVSGIREVRTMLSVQPADVVAYPRFAASVAETPGTILIPDVALAGNATLKIRVTDRAGRVAESAPVAFNVVANTAPVIDTLDVAPNGEIYAGRTLGVTTAAHDDVAVQSLTLTASAGVVTPQAPQTPTPQSLTRVFSVAIPPTTPGDTNVVLTLTAADGFPNRAATTQSQTIVIRKDTLPPSATIVQPAANQQYNEGSGATFVVEVNAADAEVAVQRVTATLDGVSHELTFAASRWTKTLNVPNVDGIDPVAKTLVVKAYDYEGNVVTTDVTFLVKPLVDPDAPALSWACTSPGAMYPVGYEFTLRVNAAPGGVNPGNGVDRVELTVGNSAPIAATRIGTTTSYEAKYTIPGGTADGAMLDVRVAAYSVGGAESTLLGHLTAVAGTVIITGSTIAANDFAFENQNAIVGNGGTLTIIGEHQLRNVVVLSGGRLVQQHVDPLRADLLRVERLYVACGATFDVTSLGLPYNSAFPGLSVPDGASGGSHIGRGTTWWRATGGTFGSIDEPREPGGGGNVPYDRVVPNGYGGGMIRVQASGALVVDGSVKANGSGTSHGAGAGGSVWLATSTTLGGAGAIEAMGANAGTGGGGGGAIALEYAATTGTYITDARGGNSSAEGARTGAAGSVLRKVTGTNGDLLIDNKRPSTHGTVVTELPSFGNATIASVNGSGVTLAERRFLPSSLAGHRIRAYASDGSVRGTYRIAAVTKHPSSVTLDGWVEVRTNDAVDYDGYLLYSPNGINGSKYVAVRKFGAQWQYDSDSTFVNFIPSAGDSLFASFRKVGNRFRALDLLRCCEPVEGLPVLEVVAGDIVPDNFPPAFPEGFTNFNPGEIFIRGDIDRRGFTLVAGSPSLTLEKLTGADLLPGDRLRGYYFFDRIELANARVVTEDVVETATPLVKDASSSLQSGNTTWPRLDAVKITIEQGLTSLVVRGASGAATDTDAPLEIVARNASTPVPAPPAMRGDDFLGYGTAGGFSIRHQENQRTGGGSAGTLQRIAAEGYLAFSPGAAPASVQVSLSPDDTTSSYEEPGHNSFRLTSAGSYEIWANGAYTGKTGTYAASTAFRIEKTATAMRWFVDNVQLHERTTGVPGSVLFDLSFFNTATGEISSIEYVTSGLPPRSHHARVGADGSFRVPVIGAPGEPLRIHARDRHPYSLESNELALTIPANLGIATLSFTPADVTGGHTTTGTVTLESPAGSEGVLVALTSASALVAVPVSITIPAGQLSGTFTATTTAVLTPTDVNVTATYGGRGPTAVVHVLRDDIAPTATITAPAANSEHVEGTKITVRATASDEDSGVKTVSVTLDGVTTPMTLAAGVWSAQVTVPFIDGTSNVAKQLVVTVEDNSANVANSAPLTIQVKPISDSQPPALTWNCGGYSAWPASSVAKLRLLAKAPAANPANSVNQVDVVINGVTIAATALGNELFEVTWNVPAVATDTTYAITATATAAGGGVATLNGEVTAVVIDQTFSTDTTIAAATTTYDNKSIAVTAGTLTIAGAHTFKHLLVLGGSVTHAAGDATLKLTTTGQTYVACGAAIDVTARGYANSATYAGAATPVPYMGGSHIGVGYQFGAGSTFGSITVPNEFGGAAWNSGAGGGIVRIDAGRLHVDGAIRANGQSADRGGAGGSVDLNAGRIHGAGSIEARAADLVNEAGGGGAIAIRYTDATSVVPATTARGGVSDRALHGGGGSVYVRGPASTYGDLTLDNGTSATMRTELPSLGSGLAVAGSSGTTLVTDRATNIPAYFEQHWVEIRGKGTWRIASVGGKSVTLAPNGSESIDIQPGDAWQGLYLFDNVTLRNLILEPGDAIRAANVTVRGNVTATRLEASGTFTVDMGAVLTHATGHKLHLLAGTLELRGAIDVTAKGYGASQTWPGAQTAHNWTGGSHLGAGYDHEARSTFGSVTRPNEWGAGAFNSGAGGGVVRIEASRVVFAGGSILANGQRAERTGGGGSVWITANKLEGGGAIEARAGDDVNETGGGGAISVEYSDATSTLPSMLVRGGTSTRNLHGGSGTTFLRGPGATFGELILDGAGLPVASTELPSLGNGLAVSGTSGATLVTDRATDITGYFVGHWVEIAGKGTWQIASVAAKTITLRPNASEAIALVAGDAWQGVYRFDTVRSRSAVQLDSDDPIRVVNGVRFEGPPSTEIRIRPELDTPSVVIAGRVAASRIRATDVTIESGGTLTHESGRKLHITTQTLNVRGAIDVTGRGYANNQTGEGATTPHAWTGGSHIGAGYGFAIGSTFGSITAPFEWGGGGYFSHSGGGVVRVEAQQIAFGAAGAIRANGGIGSERAGAGGSI